MWCDSANDTARRDSTLVLDRSGHGDWRAAGVARVRRARVEERPDSLRYLDVPPCSWAPTAPAGAAVPPVAVRRPRVMSRPRLLRTATSTLARRKSPLKRRITAAGDGHERPRAPGCSGIEVHERPAVSRQPGQGGGLLGGTVHAAQHSRISERHPAGELPAASITSASGYWRLTGIEDRRSSSVARGWEMARRELLDAHLTRQLRAGHRRWTR